MSRKRFALILSAFFIATCYTFTAIMHVYLNSSDFVGHVNLVEKMLAGERTQPHFLFPFLLIGINYLFNISFMYAAYAVTFISVFLSFIVAYNGIKDNNISIKNNHLIWCTIFLLISHPVFFLYPYDNNIYFGYIATNVYHNPTILLLKPVALFHFISLCSLLKNNKNANKTNNKVYLLALMTALSIITKPNYIIALIPALLLFLSIRFCFATKIYPAWDVILIGVLIPACSILLWQYYYFFGVVDNNSIHFGILYFFKMTSKLWTLPLKLLASLAFPISVLIIMRSKLTIRIDFQLSFCMFLISLIYTYFLIDKVADLPAGNFGWSAQISNFLLLFVSIRAYLAYLPEIGTSFAKSANRFIYTPIIIGGFQFFFGVIWMLLSPYYALTVNLVQN